MLAEKITKKLWAANPDDWGPIIAAELEPLKQHIDTMKRIADECGWNTRSDERGLVSASIECASALIDGEDG